MGGSPSSYQPVSFARPESRRTERMPLVLLLVGRLPQGLMNARGTTTVLHHPGPCPLPFS
jgi:hypothetical protein